MTRAYARWPGLLLLATSILLSAIGQLCMKVGMQELHRAAMRGPLDFSLSSLASLPSTIGWTAAGLAVYVCSLLAWLAVLVRYPLSLAYPLLSLSYVLVYIGATHWPRLMETATPWRTAGTLLIMAGVSLVSLTDNRQNPPVRPTAT